MDFSPCDVSPHTSCAYGEVGVSPRPGDTSAVLPRPAGVGCLEYRSSLSASVRNLFGLTWAHPPSSGKQAAERCTRTLKMDVSIVAPREILKSHLFTFSVFATMIFFIARKSPVNLISSGHGTKSQFLKNCGKQCDVCLFKHLGSMEGVAMGTVRFTLTESGSIWHHTCPQRPTYSGLSP